MHREADAINLVEAVSYRPIVIPQSLIPDRWTLSPAHCIYSSDSTIPSSQMYLLLAGLTLLATYPESPTTRHNTNLEVYPFPAPPVKRLQISRDRDLGL
jgi:hypothetical protein